MQEHECEFIEFGSSSILILQLEPNIYWMLSTPSMSNSLELIQDSGKTFLKRLHSLFILMFQRVEIILDCAGARVAHQKLQGFLQDYMPDVMQGDGWCTVRDLYTPLTPHTGLPLLTIPTPLFMGVFQ